MTSRRPPPSAGGESLDGTRVEMKDFADMTKMGAMLDIKSTDTLTRIDSLESEHDLGEDVEGHVKEKVVANMEDIALKALHIDDDPTLNPWTLRMFVLGR